MLYPLLAAAILRSSGGLRQPGESAAGARAVATQGTAGPRGDGAGRERLVRQMLTESLLLAGAGGVCGMALAMPTAAVAGKTRAHAIADRRNPDDRSSGAAVRGRGRRAPPELRSEWFPRCACCAAPIRTGCAKARAPGGGRKERLRSALVIAEVTGSVVLLVACGLLLRALWRIEAIDPGFRADHVLTLETSLPMPKYQRTAVRHQFYQRVLSQAGALPGVTGAAYISFLPMVMRGGIWPVEVEGHPRPV